MHVLSFQCGEHLIIEVAVTGRTAKAYRADGGLERTPLLFSENGPLVEFPASDPVDAVNRMRHYLEEKYGACEPVQPTGPTRADGNEATPDDPDRGEG